MSAADRGNDARLVSIDIADQPQAWESAGFAVAEGQVTLGSTTIDLTGAASAAGQRGIVSWTVTGLDHPEATGSIDGIRTHFNNTDLNNTDLNDTDLSNTDLSNTVTSGDQMIDEAASQHPNGASGIDHVVIATPDLERTLAAFAEVGLAVRRIRDTESYGSPMKQAFLRVGATIVEVVSAETGTGQTVEEAPATWFGLALDVADLDQVQTLLGDGLGSVRQAVQAGRRIATIRNKSFDISVPVALMDTTADAPTSGSQHLVGGEG